MKDLKAIVLSLPLLVTLSVPSLAQEKSLYDRLGGNNAINAIVDDFVNKIISDIRINKKFAKSDPTRFITNLKDFICVITGGPCKYNGNDMKSAHKGMGVTEGEFNALFEDLVMTLDKLKIPTNEINELLVALAKYKPLIVEKNSQETGAEVPNHFKPTPPLETKAKKIDNKSILSPISRKEINSISVDRAISVSTLRASLTKQIANNNAASDHRARARSAPNSRELKVNDTGSVNLTLDYGQINKAAVEFYNKKYGSKVKILKNQSTIEILIEGIKGEISNDSNFWEKLKIQTYIFSTDWQVHLSIVIHGKCASGWNQPGDKDYKDIEDQFPGRLNEYADKLITDLTNYLKGEN